jgi:energy-coupling factor transporter ATP-binding protein EcfA2
MKLEHLSITNFRSFGEKTDVDLSSKGGYFSIVGPNASGKSNLLEALRWVTAERSYVGSNMEEHEFHGCDPTKALVIEANIAPPIRVGDTFNRFHDVEKLRFSASLYKVGDEKGSIRSDNQALDKDDRQIMLGLTTPLAKSRELTADEKRGRAKPRPLMVRDIKDRLPVYYLDSSSYTFHLTMSRGSLLWRLAQQLLGDLSKDSEMITWRGAKWRRSDALREVEADIRTLLRTSRLAETTTSMGSFLTEMLELPEDAVGMDVGLLPGDELLNRLALLSRDRKAMPLLPVARMGRGYGALAIVALFRAMNELGDQCQGSIVLLEEPEVFLSPHLRAVFFQTLKGLADKGNQLIVSTHAPEFVDAFSPQSIILVRRQDAATEISQWPSDAVAPAFDPTLKIVQPNLGRLVLSRRVLFVEGPDDFAAVDAVFQMAGIDAARKGLEVLWIGGKGNIKHLAPYAERFNIPWAALFDGDASGLLASVDPTAGKWRTWNPDLEGSLHTAKADANSEHVARVVLDHGAWPAVKTKCPDFAMPLADVLKTLDITL